MPDDDDFIVRVAPSVTDHAYRALDGRPLVSLPAAPEARPDAKQLAAHNERCGWLGSGVPE